MLQNISVVFPVYNESKNIKNVVKETFVVLGNLFREFEIIIVNDGSNDGSKEITTQLAETYKNVHVVHHQRNYGYGVALRSGLDKAIFNLILLCDADAQFDVSEIHKLLPYIQQYDIIIGYRKDRKDPLYRKLLGKIYNFTVRLLFKTNFKDVNCGFKLFNSHIIKRFNFYSTGGIISAEILVRANKEHARIKEVGIDHKKRLYGKPSGAKFRTIAVICYELISLFLRFAFNKH